MAELGFLPALLALAASRKAGGGGASKGKQDRMVNLTEKEQRFAVRAGGILFGLGLTGVAIWGGNKLYKNWRANREANKGLNQSDPAAFAKRIRLTIEGPGTNEKLLRNAISEIPSKAFWNEVIASYRKQYDRNLINDLEDDLDPGEYLEMLQIVSTLGIPRNTVNQAILTSWAKRLQIAFDYKFWGIPDTDTDAVFKVMQEVPTKKAYNQLDQTYKTVTGNDLMADLKRELSKSEQLKVRDIYLQQTLTYDHPIKRKWT